jgi:predicted Rossmann fold nucleotide-binding protein DprA/Smf involved in DNA uptake
MNKLAVIGSRTFDDYQIIKEELASLDFSTIVSGGAQGADSLGARYAKENNKELIVFLPDWERFERSAGMIRNKQIVDYCDELIAFWNGESKGTSNSINLATKQNKLIKLIWVE